MTSEELFLIPDNMTSAHDILAWIECNNESVRNYADPEDTCMSTYDEELTLPVM